MDANVVYSRDVPLGAGKTRRKERDQRPIQGMPSEGAADQSNLLGLKDVTQGQSSCLTCLVSQDIYRKKKNSEKYQGVCLSSHPVDNLLHYIFSSLIYTRVSGWRVCPVCLEMEFRTLCVLGNCSTTELQTPALRDMLDHCVPQLLYEKANY